MKKTFILTRTFFHFFPLLVLLSTRSPLIAQTQDSTSTDATQNRDMSELINSLHRASREKEYEDLRMIVEEILARDVIADFISHGTSPAKKIMSALRKMHVLGEKVELWEHQLSEQPGSERLNYLLAVAEPYFKQVTPSESGKLDKHLPVRLKISRDGGTFTGEVIEDQWGSGFPAQIIPMPRKVLIGFTANGVKANLSEPVLIRDGVGILDVEWTRTQISRSSTTGKMEVTEDGIEITGAGWRPGRWEADTMFFAFTELEGDGSLEVVVDEMDPNDRGGAVGIMIRASLDPGAPYVAIMAERRDHRVSMYVRKELSKTGHYLSVLSEARPQDPDFILPLLGWMLESNFAVEAQLAADRLLQADPGLLLNHMTLFQNVFERSGSTSRFKELVAASASEPQDESQQRQTAYNLNRQAGVLQDQGDHVAALAAWDQVRELSPGGRFSLEDSLQYLISIMKLDRLEQLKRELKLLFTGDAPNENFGMSPSEEMLHRVHLSDPALGPMIMPIFHMAAEYGVAGEIAAELEKTQGSPQKIAAARSVALALKAAEDPSSFAPLHVSLDPLPDQGLALMAFVLQQTPEGRSNASFLVERLLERASGSGGSKFDKGVLLLWESRLADLRGDEKVQTHITTALATHLLTGTSSHDTVRSQTVQRLLRSGDVDLASRILDQSELVSQRKKPDPDNLFSFDPYDPVAEAIYLKNLHEGKDPVVPVIWTESAGDDVIVHWELAPDSTRAMSNMMGFEARALGASVPQLDGRFELLLYGTHGLDMAGTPHEDQRFAHIRSAASAGSWRGKGPGNRRWIIATLREGDQTVSASRSVPVRSGKNLLAPLDPQNVLTKTGKWSSLSKWFWGGALAGEFPKNAVFISRLQRVDRAIPIDHEPIPIRPNEVYNFSGWIRTDTGQQGRYRYVPDAKFQVLFFDQAGNQVTEWTAYPSIGGRWVYLTQQFGPGSTPGNTVIPSTAVSAMVRILVNTQGEVGDIGFYRAPAMDSSPE